MNRILYTICILLLWQCASLDSADPVNRNTFLKFYERGYNYSGRAIEVLEDGYLFAGDLENGLSLNSIITKTDLQGNVIWEKEIENTSTYSLLVTADGYFVFGARIEVNPDAEQVNDIVKYKAVIAKIGSSGEVSEEHILQDAKNLNTEFIGNSLTTDTEGNIYGVGSMTSSGQQTKSFTVQFDPGSLDTLWYEEYSLIDRDYVNAKSAFVTTAGRILWTSSAKTAQQNKSYLVVPVVTPNSTFVNNNPFGSLEDKYYSGEDVKQSAVGYGAIGTYYNTQSQSSNMYFIRLDVAGNIIPGSDQYFDAATGKGPEVSEKDNSATEDTGDAITVTSEGGYLLAGSMVTTPDFGNGGKDIFLVKLDAFGVVIWSRVLGGTGDEQVRNIRTTPDGGFILCGTSTISGLSSVFIMKLNKEGELKD